jgi:hypothetical protein
MRNVLLLLGSLSFSATAAAEPHLDIHGLIDGGTGARFLKGVPTLDLALQNGAVQVRPLGFDHNDTVFAVSVFNASLEPANVALEDFHAMANGAPVRIWTGKDLARQAKNRAMWAQLGIAFVSGLGAGLAASARTSYHSRLSTPYGSYSFRGSYPSLAGQLAANDIAANGALSMALVQQRLDMALQNIDDSVVQRTTVDPGTAYGAIVVVDKLDYSRAPLELNLSLDWNGERYPFTFLLTKAGQPAPIGYTTRLAENVRPHALRTPWSAASVVPAAERFAAPHLDKPVSGSIYLASGAVKVPAKTASGYCLQVPPDYSATGDLNYPAVSGALPLCADRSHDNENGWYPASRRR